MISKQNKKKKVFAEIRRLFLAEIRNLNGFSGQKQQLFPPKSQDSNLDGGRLNLELVRVMLTFKKKYSGGQEINRGGNAPPAGDVPDENSSTLSDNFQTCRKFYSFSSKQLGIE